QVGLAPGTEDHLEVALRLLRVLVVLAPAVTPVALIPAAPVVTAVLPRVVPHVQRELRFRPSGRLVGAAGRVENQDPGSADEAALGADDLHRRRGGAGVVVV